MKKFTPKQWAVIYAFLAGDISSRKAGKYLGVSHQSVINMVSSLARRWYKTGQLQI